MDAGRAPSTAPVALAAGHQQGQQQNANTPIVGLDLLDPGKIHADFVQLRSNPLYFVDHCIYYPKRGAKGEPRVFALTTTALFVTDSRMELDRATNYIQVTELYEKRVKGKKLLSFSSHDWHLLIKIPSEFDCHISFSSTSAYERCAHVLQKILEARCPKPIHVKGIAPDKEVDDYFNDTPAEGYFTPREMTEIMRQRSYLEVYVRVGKEDVAGVLNQLQRAKVQIAARENELKKLKEKGIDEESIRTRKAEIEEVQVRLGDQVRAAEAECAKQIAEINSLQSKLGRSQEAIEKLVEDGVREAMVIADQKHEEMVQLRRRAQQRELDKLAQPNATYHSEITAVSQYTAPGCADTIKEAQALEASVKDAMEKWKKDLDGVHRIKKFLATINAEIEAQNDLINAKNFEKQVIIQKRTAVAPPVSVARNTDGIDLDLLVDNDDLLGSGSPVDRPADPLLGSPTAGEDLL